MTDKQATTADLCREQQESIARLVAERDTYKEDTEELIASKKKVEFDARMQSM